MACFAGILINFLLNPTSTLLISLVSGATLGVLLYLAFRASLRHVWVTLSVDGIAGAGATSRDLRFGWEEPLVVENANQFGFRGVTLRRAQDGGVLPRRVASLFIPAPILELESFRASLEKLAPRSHPLRRKIEGEV